MLPKLMLAFAAAPVLFLSALASADYAIVDVREKGPDGHHFVVPVPILLVQGALAFAPPEARSVELPPEAAAHVASLLPILDRVRALPDFELVRVEGRDDQVSIRKEKDLLAVDVRGKDAEVVRLRLPLAAARAALASMDGNRFRTTDLVGALGRSSGDLLHVNDRNTEIRVRIW